MPFPRTKLVFSEINCQYQIFQLSLMLHRLLKWPLQLLISTKPIFISSVLGFLKHLFTWQMFSSTSLSRTLYKSNFKSWNFFLKIQQIYLIHIHIYYWKYVPISYPDSKKKKNIKKLFRPRTELIFAAHCFKQQSKSLVAVWKSNISCKLN